MFRFRLFIIISLFFTACRQKQTLSTANEQVVTAKEQKAEAQKVMIAVGGDVRVPQRIPWSPELTLMQALGLAGGTGWNQHSAYIIRDEKRILYKLRPIVKDPTLDPKLQPGDKVEVP